MIRLPNVRIALGDTDPLDAAREGVSSIQGRRPEMEDAHFFAHYTNGVRCYGVFDGHGGGEVSAFLSRAVPLQVAIAMSAAPGGGGTLDISEEVLSRGFDMVHAAMSEHTPQKHWLESGSTAVVALLQPGRAVYVANTGDSRAVLVEAHSGEARALSTDHKPDTPAEMRRLGGYQSRVTTESKNDCARVSGTGLAVSRAFGDLAYTSYGIVHHPDVVVHSLTSGSGTWYLVLGCDGVWDVLSNADVGTLIKETLAAGTTTPADLARRIQETAYARGSSDNITALVVRVTDDGDAS